MIFKSEIFSLYRVQVTYGCTQEIIINSEAKYIRTSPNFLTWICIGAIDSSKSGNYNIGISVINVEEMIGCIIGIECHTQKSSASIVVVNWSLNSQSTLCINLLWISKNVYNVGVLANLSKALILRK